MLIAYELTHHLLNKREGELGYAALKLDMSKAYDHVEWNFLEAMMRRLGFAEEWIRLIMECVTSVSYCIRVNGDLTEKFKPERGLRQGTRCHPTCFYYAQKAFRHYYSRLSKLDRLLE